MGKLLYNNEFTNNKFTNTDLHLQKKISNRQYNFHLKLPFSFQWEEIIVVINFEKPRYYIYMYKVIVY